MRDIVASLSHETWLISRNVDASKNIFCGNKDISV
jgi:hypothetical protein